ATRQLTPAGGANPEGVPLLQYQIPKVESDGRLLPNRKPRYQSLDANATNDVLSAPGVVQITLPAASELRLWSDLEPLEPGTRDFPPALDDTALNERVITWLRVRSSAAVQAKLQWLGINAALVSQRAHVANELLPNGTGEPDQSAMLSQTPVIANSVRVSVTVGGQTETWQEIDDLTAAGPEVPTPDLRQPPGVRPVVNPRVNVFAVNVESGEIRFGDGARGRRPPLGAIIRADYDYGVGPLGNVGAGSINSGPALPAGLKVTNPVRTWGGASAETVSDGEKQIARYLQHRDRLVNAADFETIAWRTPGVDMGRIEVLPAFNPDLSPNEPGDAPGAVTLMVIPKYDPQQPDAPRPDRLFLDAICDYLDSRRLVTTELFLREPNYRQIWISAGINVVAGYSIAVVREAVKAALKQFLAPLPATPSLPTDGDALLTTPQYADMQRGWPLRKPVVDMELLAVASRVPGVRLVNKVLLAEGTTGATTQVPMSGLDLPRVMGIAVTVGDAVSLETLRGQETPPPSDGSAGTDGFVPVPVIPEECQ
ncbi:MAG: baseplate J/gp47 family protein, partial [Chloroflexota bacterium]